MQPPPTQYVERDGISIAYQVAGDGPVDLLMSPGFISHLDLLWTDPGISRTLARLASFSRLIIYDKPGTGLSDPIPQFPTLEERVADLEAVLDAAGSEHAVLFGVSEGGPTSVLMAAMRPQRVASLILYGTFAVWPTAAPEDFSPETVERAELHELLEATKHWGEVGKLMESFAPSVTLTEQQKRAFGIFARAAASPRMARALVETWMKIDIRDVLASVRVPTLVLHVDGDRVVPVEAGRCSRTASPGRASSSLQASITTSGSRGSTRSSTPEQLELFGSSLDPRDRVALEVSGSAWEVARILERHVARVVVVSPADTGIRQARAKTDRLDARTLARLLAAGEPEGVFSPDERCRVMRRRLSRREQLVRTRSRSKNEIHAVLVRRLVGRPPVVDLFGVGGRRWLAQLELPLEESETIGACLRHVEFLDSEIAAVERQIAAQALDSPEIRRLMTVPGVNVICAATFMAAVGEIGRFPTQRQLVGYLGLDPRVYQSGSAPATSGHISKQGSASTRRALVEAAWSVVRQPGPQHAFYQRVRARRGHGIAVVASARKLACLFWFLLTRGEDYAHQQPSLTAKKLRLLEIRAGARTLKGTPIGVWATRQAMREGERRLAEQAEASYKQIVRDWQAAAPKKVGASVTPGRASQKPSKGKVARQTTSP